MRKFKDIRKLAERHDPEDYKKEKDPDSEVNDWEPRAKGEKEFVGKHDITKKNYPKKTDAFKADDTEVASDTSKSRPGEKKPVFQGKGKSFHKMKEDISSKLEEEQVEELEEAVKAGSMKLKDGSSVNVSNEEAKTLNKVLGDLKPDNKKRMEDEMKADKKSFRKILDFAKQQD
jgi:hypothetical protein